MCPECGWTGVNCRARAGRVRALSKAAALGKRSARPRAPENSIRPEDKTRLTEFRPSPSHIRTEVGSGWLLMADKGRPWVNRCNSVKAVGVHERRERAAYCVAAVPRKRQ